MSQHKGNPQIRIPPQDADAERAVLGSIMVRSGAIHEVTDILDPKTFYSDKNGIIFEAMRDLSMKNEPIDMLSVATKLKDKKQFDSVGGNAYLAELTSSVPSSTNAKYYADIVQKKHILRELIRAADHIAELGFAESDEDADSIVDQAEKHLLDMKGRPNATRAVPIKEVLTGAMERFESLHQNPGGLRGVPSGFKKLDDMLSGFQKSDLIILAARPSVGKTTFALDVAKNAAVKHGQPTIIFSLEMSSHQLIDRMVASHSQVDAWKLRTGIGFKKEEEYEKLQQAVGELAQAPIFIDDQAGSNIIRLRNTARRIKKEHGLGLIVIDYLQLMTPVKTYDNMVNQVTEISRGLKALAKEFDVPVIALSQLSRAVESRGGEPKLSDLRDSGSIEQDADVVMFLHRVDDKFETGGNNSSREIKVIIGKHRNGPIGAVSMMIDGNTTSFLEVANEYAGVTAPQGPAPTNKYDLSDF